MYHSGLHKQDYTPFIVTKLLLGDYIALRRSWSRTRDDHCADWKDGELPDKNSNWHWTHRIYSEGDRKLYRLSDISEEPSKSDLAGNKGLREDFARRQNERSRVNTDARYPPQTYSITDSPLGTSFPLESEETLVPSKAHSTGYPPSERWGDSQETLF